MKAAAVELVPMDNSFNNRVRFVDQGDFYNVQLHTNDGSKTYTTLVNITKEEAKSLGTWLCTGQVRGKGS